MSPLNPLETIVLSEHSQGFKGDTRGSPIMPRDVGLSDSKCWNGGHEWVKRLRTKKPLALPLAPLVWKLIAGIKPGPGDLEEVTIAPPRLFILL